jgi:hypothetical protein
MTVAYEQFLSMFPEFADSTLYARDSVELWLQTADETLSGSASNFGSRYAMANGLFAAHYLTIGRNNTINGGSTSGMAGPISSKHVGAVGVSYQGLGDYFYKNRGFWNMSTYGLMLMQMFRVAAAGGMYIPSRGRYSPVGPRRFP